MTDRLWSGKLLDVAHGYLRDVLSLIERALDDSHVVLNWKHCEVNCAETVWRVESMDVSHRERTGTLVRLCYDLTVEVMTEFKRNSEACRARGSVELLMKKSEWQVADRFQFGR